MAGGFDVGLFAGSDATSVTDAIARVRDAAADGFEMVWLPQTNGLDAFTVLAIAGREVADIALGTAVVPIQGRHPIPLALQALTAADAAGPGRLTVGLGVTHPSLSEGWFGVPYRGIVDVCEEVIEALDGLFSHERRCNVSGDHVTARVSTPRAASAASRASRRSGATATRSPPLV